MAKTKLVVDIFDEIETEGQETVDIWGSVYLPIQWQNQLGQWEAPLEHWGGSMLEFEYEISQVRHQANVVPGFLMDSISIAPFAFKVHWGYKDSEGKYHATDQPDWSISDAWRSRVHILALMREAESLTPVILTAGSNTGKHLLANVRQGQRRIANMLKKINRPNVPTHLFWMEMIAGPPVTVGEGETSQTICPPVAVAPASMQKMTPKAIAKHLTGSYVGHDIKDAFNDGLLDEGQEWSIKQPERLQIGNGNGNGDDNIALPPATIKAAVLDDGTLWFPDLSGASVRDMKDCGMSVPGLFNHQSHADRAFSKLMREKRISGEDGIGLVWETWRVELEARYADQEALKQSQMREAELRDSAPHEDEIPF
jgi:hypothetical protein